MCGVTNSRFARLFPDLEKDMRRIDFKHQQGADGGVNNRTDLPSPPHPTGEHPFADGHASCILKAYREALNQPDEAFLTEYWPHVHRAVEYLIARDAKSNGGEPGGILQDDQWNTYDEALHGVTHLHQRLLSGGAACRRGMGPAPGRRRHGGPIPRHLRERPEEARRAVLERRILPAAPAGLLTSARASSARAAWPTNSSANGGRTSLAWAISCRRTMVVSSFRAIFKYNFKSDLTGWPHAPRAFAGAKDKGLIICTWPKGGRPANVMLYSDEVWTGIEYQVAAHMIYEGLIEEGFAIIKAARDRYDGVPRPPIPRNPWNEIECGGHYARAMSSWSLLPALSGWQYDGPRQALRFIPRHTPDQFKCFFTAPEAWGSASQSRQGQAQRNEITVCEGRLPVSTLALAATPAPKSVEVQCAGKSLESSFTYNAGVVAISLKSPAVAEAGQSMTVRLT